MELPIASDIMHCSANDHVMKPLDAEYVIVDGKPSFEMLPIRSDDPDFIDRLLMTNPEFRKLMEERRKEADAGRTSSLESVRHRLGQPHKE